MEFIELEKVYRQTEPEFIELLNASRNRFYTDEDIEKLNARYVPGFVPPDDAFYVTLTSTNDLATVRNLEKLDALRGRSSSMIARSPDHSTGPLCRQKKR